MPTADKTDTKQGKFVVRSSHATVSDGNEVIRKTFQVDDEVPMQNLSGSWIGALFQIEYKLRVFVKHEAFLELGKGKCISFPIRVYNTPVLVQSQEPYRVPDNWNPQQGITEPVYLYMQKDETSDYYKKVFKPNWEKW